MTSLANAAETGLAETKSLSPRLEARAHLAFRNCGAGVRHGGRGRRHPPDGLRPFDHGMAAHPWRRAADERSRMAGRIREIPAYPRVQPDQSRHDPRRLQGHLLVGMDAPASRTAYRGRIFHPLRDFPCCAAAFRGRSYRGSQRFSFWEERRVRLAGSWSRAGSQTAWM